MKTNVLVFFLDSRCIYLLINVDSSPVSRCNRRQSIASESLLTTEAVNEQQLLEPGSHPRGVGFIFSLTQLLKQIGKQDTSEFF